MIWGKWELSVGALGCPLRAKWRCLLTLPQGSCTGGRVRGGQPGAKLFFQSQGPGLLAEPQASECSWGLPSAPSDMGKAAGDRPRPNLASGKVPWAIGPLDAMGWGWKMYPGRLF